MSDIVCELLDRAYSHKPNDFLCERAAMEIERLRLTDAEREAIELFATLEWTSLRWSKVEKNAVTLRNLLARLA
jgi:hypothetical protein